MEESNAENNTVVIDYLKHNFDHKDVFHKSDNMSELDYEIPMTAIVMKLPAPEKHRRGNKYFFNCEIDLKNINI